MWSWFEWKAGLMPLFACIWKTQCSDIFDITSIWLGFLHCCLLFLGVGWMLCLSKIIINNFKQSLELGTQHGLAICFVVTLLRRFPFNWLIVFPCYHFFVLFRSSKLFLSPNKNKESGSPFSPVNVQRSLWIKGNNHSLGGNTGSEFLMLFFGALLMELETDDTSPAALFCCGIGEEENYNSTIKHKQEWIAWRGADGYTLSESTNSNLFEQTFYPAVFDGSTFRSLPQASGFREKQNCLASCLNSTASGWIIRDFVVLVTSIHYPPSIHIVNTFAFFSLLTFLPLYPPLTPPLIPLLLFWMDLSTI